MNSENATWILQMMRKRDAKTDAERDAIDFAIQAIKERDAAVEDVERIKACHDCKHFSKYRNDCLDLKECNWEWRGVQNENR